MRRRLRLLVLPAVGLLWVGCSSSSGTDPGTTAQDAQASTDVVAIDTAVGPTDTAVTLDASDAPAPPDGFVVSIPDVSTAPPDIQFQKQPLGGFCQTGDDCIDGYCNVAYADGYCTRLCETGEDCPSDGKCFGDPLTDVRMCWQPCERNSHCRIDHFCPAGAGICTPKCRLGDCNPGYVCEPESGQCLFEDQVDPCVPSAEICDDEDNDCDNIVDEGCGPAPAETPRMLVTDWGKVNIGGGGLTSRTVEISTAASSFAIMLRSADGSEEVIGLYSLSPPDGSEVYDVQNPYGSPNRAVPGIGVVTVLVPNTPNVAMQAGTWNFSFFREGTAGKGWLYVLQPLRQQTTNSTMDVNLWFAGTEGLSASTAPSNSKFQSLLSLFGELMTEYGISLGNVKYYDVTGANAQKYAIVDTGNGYEVDEHAELVALSRDLPPDNIGVNFFFVRGFTGWSLLGKAGSIPGPPLLNGTWSSGVVVSMADYEHLSPSDGVPLMAETMAHELGHQLGLFHTTEQDGQSHDPIPDTKECDKDFNNDGIVDAYECSGWGAENLMFWQANLSAELSAGQKFVFHRNPQLSEP